MRKAMNEGLIAKEKWWEWMEDKKGRVFLTERAKSRYGKWFPPEVKIVKSGKEILLPPGEEVYRYFWTGEKWRIKEREISASPAFLFSLPCEARAIIEVTDKIFLNNPIDKNYWLRRKSLSLGIMACLQPEPTCFCSSVGGGPFWRDEGALFLVPREDDIYIQGEGELFSFSEGVEEKIKEEIQALQKKAESVLPSLLPSYFPQELYRYFEDEEWNELSWHCINCGACTFLCPTCYCFDLNVEGKLKGFQLRSWDSCMFPKFTLHASFHNPRPTGKERVRQRVMHKFSYFPEREGNFACVGCGVCVEKCPVNWDIREAIERMVEKIDRFRT